ncbi:MAG: hypothetical protein ACLUFH_09590 [Monoglobales bacterium]
MTISDLREKTRATAGGQEGSFLGCRQFVYDRKRGFQEVRI